MSYIASLRFEINKKIDLIVTWTSPQKGISINWHNLLAPERRALSLKSSLRNVDIVLYSEKLRCQFLIISEFNTMTLPDGMNLTS